MRCSFIIKDRKGGLYVVWEIRINEHAWSQFNYETIYWFKLTPGAPEFVRYRVPNDQLLKVV
jgi:hypothetical protein